VADDVVQRILIKADGSQAKAEARMIEDRFASMFDKSAIKAAAFNQALALGQRAVATLAAELRKGFQAAMDFERTTAQMVVTLKQLGDVNATWLATMQHQAAELQRLSGVSDEQIRRLQIMAMSSGVATDEVDKLIRAGLMLANAFDKDLRTMVEQLIKSKTGLVEESLRATGALEGLTKEQLKAGKAVETVTKKLGGQLDVLTKGTAGGAMGLNSAWGDFTESLSAAAAKSSVAETALSGVAKQLRSMTNIMYKDGLLAGLAQLASGVSGYRGSLAMIAEALGYGTGVAAEGGKPEAPLESFGGKGEGAGGGRPKFVLTETFDFGGKGGVGGMTFGGGGKGGKGGGGGGGVPTVEKYIGKGDGIIPGWNMAEDSYTDDVATDWTAMIAERQAAAEAYAEIELGIEENKAERIRAIEAQMLADLQAARAEDLKLQQQQVQEHINMGMRVANMALGAFNNLLSDIITGSDNAGQKFAAAMLKGVGQMLQGKGMAHLAEAAAIAFIPGLQGNATGLAAAGAAEIALGTALMAGGIAATPQAQTGAPGGAVPQPSAGAGEFAGGYTGGSGSADKGTGDKVINIHLDGPVYDGASAGRAIAEKIAEAKRQGLI